MSYLFPSPILLKSVPAYKVTVGLQAQLAMQVRPVEFQQSLEKLLRRIAIRPTRFPRVRAKLTERTGKFCARIDAHYKLIYTITPASSGQQMVISLEEIIAASPHRVGRIPSLRGHRRFMP